MGGVCSKSKQILDSVELLDLKQTFGWMRLRLKLPAPLFNMNAVCLPDGILLVGGKTLDDQTTQKCYKMCGLQSIQPAACLPFCLPDVKCAATSSFD